MNVILVTRSVTGFLQRLPPWPASLAMAPLMTWLVSSLLLGWAGVEALAAFERWIENEVRFHS